MRPLVSSTCVVPLLLLLAGPGSGPAPEARLEAPESQHRRLTFEERVEAQRAIEQVYYSHQIDARLPFDEAVPKALLEDKVRASLKQSEALRDLWNTPITGEALRSEVERITAHTRFPDRLREIYAALGNDAFLVQETLGRATLTARLARNFYAHDVRMHDEKRREAESLRDNLAAGRIDPSTRDRRATIIEIHRAGNDRPEGGSERAVRPPGDEIARLDMAQEEFDRWRSTLPGEIGGVGPVEEGRGGFTVSVLLAEGPGWARASTYSISKRPWESFWREVADRYDETKVEPAASPAATLPGPAEATPDCVPDDTWFDTSTGDAPMARWNHTAVWTGSQMIIWGGVVGSTRLKTGGRYDPITDTWLPTTTVNAPDERDSHTAIWTGDRMVVWGGSGNGAFMDSGGRYDPIADLWTPTSTAGAPIPRREHTAVWTGSRMIVWGGVQPGLTPINSGGRYNPAADTWTPISLAGAPEARSRHRALWTGTTMIVWGGINLTATFNSGGRYDPKHDTWAPTSLLDAPAPRTSFVAVWTGSEMIVWGGEPSGSNGGELNTGGRYDPGTDRWSPTKLDATTPPGLGWGTAVWSGSEMIVWGGICACGQSSVGSRYDPVADTWSAMSAPGAPSYRSGHSAVWTGGQMIVWGGAADQYRHLRTGGRYDPVSNVWTPTSADYVPAPTTGHTALWTGTLMLIWGGNGDPYQWPHGGRYDPTLDTWTEISTTSQPAERSGHSAVWTGLEMVVWGGRSTFYHNDGGRYSPLTDSWTAISTFNPPQPRENHTAVWTGRRMIIWGGRAGSTTFGNGAVLDLQETPTLAWSGITSLNAPSPRYGHSAVWTGTRMVVWGGSGDSSGGVFDPAANVWTPMSLADAPSPRSGQAAVWTGREMIIWGGQATVTPQVYLDSGGRYDPLTGTWGALPAAGGPPGRKFPAAVWTGGEMIVWGGERGNVLESTGGRYSPASDAWSPVSNVAAPAPRSGHTAVWSGRFMIVWGGLTSKATNMNITTNTGGLYALGQSADYDGDGVTVCGGDCDDTDPQVHPGAIEICDGKDSDCDGVLPPDEADRDYDGFRICSGDCFDNYSKAYPGAPEICDGVDSNCDGVLPPDEVDSDQDGYWACRDCNDADRTVNPGRLESCNGVDDNCDGRIDEVFPDSDGDTRADCSDCLPSDPSAFAVPGIVVGVGAIGLDPVQFEWDSLAPGSGNGTGYDVFYGTLSALRSTGGDFATGACLSSAQASTNVVVDPTPAQGDGLYIIVRARNACGLASYGTAARDAGASLSPAACP